MEIFVCACMRARVHVCVETFCVACIWMLHSWHYI